MHTCMNHFEPCSIRMFVPYKPHVNQQHNGSRKKVLFLVDSPVRLLAPTPPWFSGQKIYFRLKKAGNGF